MARQARSETPTLHGVLGIARTTRVVGATQPVSWRIVMPARMLIMSLPSSASFIPSSTRIVCASCGLQLHRAVSAVVNTRASWPRRISPENHDVCCLHRFDISRGENLHRCA